MLAPTNESFKDLDPALLEMLMQPENQELLREILLYHILPGYFPTDAMQEGPIETLLHGFNVGVNIDPLRFDDAAVVRPDTIACNGIIQVIDNVLLPSEPDFCDAFTFEELMANGQNSTRNILAVASDDPDLSIVVGLIEDAGLEKIFDCPGPFTALLPQNSAFAALDPAYLAFLRDPANRNELQDLLLYHILPGATQADDFRAGASDTLLLGKNVDVGVSPLTFDDANVVTPDILADNGLIDKIDTVLTPFPLPTSPPTAAPVEVPDICDTFTFERRLRVLQDGGENCENNVYTTALNDPNLEVITTLIGQAGLVPIFDCAGKRISSFPPDRVKRHALSHCNDCFDEQGPFTALLPSNTAFDAVDPIFLDELLLPENMEQLQNLLLYHILPGASLTTELSAGPKESLFTGYQVDVSVNPLQFDNSNVLTPDILACNGYIDIIDGVLNPFSSPICVDYTFDRRRRRLQDGGENCSGNVLDQARGNPDLSTVANLIELSGLSPIFSCAGKVAAMSQFSLLVAVFVC